MSYLTRKLIAVLLAIWLPLFGGSALAVAVTMQMQHSCHESGMKTMQMAENHQHHHTDIQAKSHQGGSCNVCGVCHLACSGYLAVQEIKSLTMQQAAAPAPPYLLSFHSITSIPLLPPPLYPA